MAHIITVHILVDEPFSNRVTEGINDMLIQAQSTVDPEDLDQESWIIDWETDTPQPVSEELNDSICNDTYEEGDLKNYMALKD